MSVPVPDRNHDQRGHDLEVVELEVDQDGSPVTLEAGSWILRICLQRVGRTHCGWCSVSFLRFVAEPDDRCRSDELQFSFGRRECTAFAQDGV